MEHIKIKETGKETETASRKDAHLRLALDAQSIEHDSRFSYEPMLAAHPKPDDTLPFKLENKSMQFPIWVSSMTGGTEKTDVINKRLAHAVAKFGLGMGVGSARIALENSKNIDSFDLRPILGDNAPFYLNFGIAQIEQMLEKGSINELFALKATLQADGFIIHVNPLQEKLQPEGDEIKHPPIETIKKFLSKCQEPLIVKEVGQGFGFESMKALLELPLAAIEFAAYGGTNFSKLEMMRDSENKKHLLPFAFVGQTVDEMVNNFNDLSEWLGKRQKCENVIVSGGIKNFLDGYYFIQKVKGKAIYGQASAFLKPAMESQEALDDYISRQIEGLMLAAAYLRVKS